MQKFVSTTVIKIAVCLLAIKEFWLLLGIPSFADAVVSFLTVGAVPGTQHTLSPGQIYVLISVTLLLVLVLVFYKDVARLISRVSASRAVHRVAIMPIPHPLHMSEFVASRPRQEQRVSHSRLGWRFRSLVLIVRVSSTRGVRVFVRTFTNVSQSAFKVLHRMALFIWAKTVACWRLAEPYIRSFDSWIEKKLHQYDKASTVLSIGSEMTSTIQRLAKDGKTFAKDNTQPAQGRQIGR